MEDVEPSRPKTPRTRKRHYTQELRLYMNFFQPSVKLRERVRKGSRRTRRYGLPLTALDWLLGLPGIDLKRLVIAVMILFSSVSI